MENIHLLQFFALFMILFGYLALPMEDHAIMIQLIHSIRLLIRLLHDIKNISLASERSSLFLLNENDDDFSSE
jgi:hypothetical protein